MEATALSQENVLQGYLDVLLAGAVDLDAVAAAREAVSGAAGRRLSVGGKMEATVKPQPVKGAAAQAGPGVGGAQGRNPTPYLHIQPVVVVGLTLALQCEAVARVMDWPADLAQLRRADLEPWIGSIEVDGREVKVLDTASVVLPPGHGQRGAMLARCRYTRLVLLADLAVALAVESVDEEVVLPRDNVRWRGDRGGYPWLAGTLPAFGYALLDPDGLPAPGA